MIYLNNVLITPTIFSDKTSQVWKLPENLLNLKNYHIKWKFDNEGEFLHLAQLKDLLPSRSYFRLEFPYLPYARQDKSINNNSTFALCTFSKLLNNLEFDEIIIHDPHSKQALFEINNSRAIYPENKLGEVITLTHSELLCYPDQGALDKYIKIYSNTHYLYGEKIRDQLTGNITSYKLFGNPKDKNVLIVDDICDYGNTFIKLTKELLSTGAKEVNLFVSHGLFSGGLKPLKDAGINRIFTPDGEITEFQNNLTIKKI